MKRKFDWDNNKERLNIRKHGYDFETAKEVFGDPFQVTSQDRFENGELRWQTIGFTKRGHLLLLVAHTTEDEEGYEHIRIISARKATKSEANYYIQGGGEL